MSATALRTIQHRIGGAETPGSSTRTAPVFDPATGAQQAEVVLADAHGRRRRGPGRASTAFETWGDVSVTRRARVMFKFRELVDRHMDELTRIISSEHGKVLDDAKGEVIRGMEVVEFACGIAQLTKGEYSDQVSTDIDALSFRQPLGVCAGITPFNFPIMVPMWMHPMAIATGNTFVLKPSERDPSCPTSSPSSTPQAGLARRRVQRRPRRQGRRRRAARPSRRRRGLFVGSTPIAKYVYERGTASGKRVQALGGAKNHAVVLPDADLDFTANHLTAAGYGSRRPALHGDRRRRRGGRRRGAADRAPAREGRGGQGRSGHRARRPRWAR